MIPYSPLTCDHVATAWRFLDECEDDDPRSYGVDLFPAYATRRYGVFRQRQPQPPFDWVDRRGESLEDAIIARLDDLEDPEEPADPPRPFDDQDECDEDAVWSAPEPVDDDDPSEALPTQLGTGRSHADVRDRSAHTLQVIVTRARA